MKLPYALYCVKDCMMPLDTLMHEFHLVVCTTLCVFNSATFGDFCGPQILSMLAIILFTQKGLKTITVQQ